jgi:plasmid stability protein
MTVRYPRDQQQRLRVLAAQRGLSREAFVRQLCDEQLQAAAELAAMPPDADALPVGSLLNKGAEEPFPPIDQG